MVTNLKPDVKQDMDYGQLVMIVALPDEDGKQNTDAIIRGFRIAWRTRRYKSTTYREISIRANRKSGMETELAKILNGKSKAKLYIFEFKDCWVICTLQDIRACLKDETKHYTKENSDRETTAAYISFDNLPHLLIPRGGIN